MIDYIIVGAGLSGSCLSYRLEKMGKSFVVFDDESQKASKVAGGLLNPVNLKRYTLAWKADEQLDEAINFYHEMEEHLGERFLTPLPVYRKFSSVEEQNNWFSAADKPRLAPFLDTRLVSQVNPQIPGKFSFGQVLKTFRMTPRHFLKTYSENLQKKGWLQKNSFEHDQLEINDSGVEYKNIKAKNVVFCEGFGLLGNPYFHYLPLIGNKGEYIIIKAPNLGLEVGIKGSIFIFPSGGDLYTVGATYNRDDKTPGPTGEAREELLKKLRELIQVDFEVVDQVAGIRPSTIDRRPLVGKHPEIQNIYTCNGFGSRGILMAPTLSQQLLNFIEEGKALDPDIDISRFTKKWYKKL